MTAEWGAFIQKLSTEWQEFVINATILLNANIAFLAIQSIDDSSVDKGCSPTQIASYVSMVKNRYKNCVYTTLESDFLHIQEGGFGWRLGLEILAIMYSLPRALLL
ncbi:uncharacterized protein ARMOST_02933 [Armillaria ostoyae]|uniref:Uncharacterized protein n=1 Tax=Armillaria ostoyae TaxID=47428 RepID=A0A284QT23_ARMOS|nr:uncharacterized protein ARMOST_02933 [Armillaria ostoyae]